MPALRFLRRFCYAYYLPYFRTLLVIFVAFLWFFWCCCCGIWFGWVGFWLDFCFCFLLRLRFVVGFKRRGTRFCVYTTRSDFSSHLPFISYLPPLSSLFMCSLYYSVDSVAAAFVSFPLLVSCTDRLCDTAGRRGAALVAVDATNARFIHAMLYFLKLVGILHFYYPGMLLFIKRDNNTSSQRYGMAFTALAFARAAFLPFLMQRNALRAFLRLKRAPAVSAFNMHTATVL